MSRWARGGVLALLLLLLLLGALAVAVLLAGAWGGELARIDAAVARASPRHVEAAQDAPCAPPWWEEAYALPGRGNETAAATTEPVKNIVLFKTHKTGSTTLAALVFRFGAQHGLQFYLTRHYHYIYPFAEHAVLPVVNISIYHHRSNQMSTRDYARWYLKIAPKAELITILREPYARALSDFFFFVQPDHPGSTLEGFLRNTTHPLRPYMHLMTTDLGIRHEDHLNMFFQHWHTYFSHILITERFDESLVLLRRKFRWRLEDVVYMKLLETCKQAARQWDKLKVTCPQKKEHLDDETLRLLTDLIQLDIRLYDFAHRRLDAELAAQPPDFWDEVVQFREMQRRLNRMCSLPWLTLQQACDKYAAHCRLFSMTDLDYERVIIDHKGNLSAPDVHRAMLADSDCALDPDTS